MKQYVYSEKSSKIWKQHNELNFPFLWKALFDCKNCCTKASCRDGKCKGVKITKFKIAFIEYNQLQMKETTYLNSPTEKELISQDTDQLFSVFTMQEQKVKESGKSQQAAKSVGNQSWTVVEKETERKKKLNFTAYFSIIFQEKKNPKATSQSCVSNGQG